MKTRSARALLLCAAAAVSCGKGDLGGAGGGDAGLMGPTNLVVVWTFAGKAASAATCMAHGGSQVYVNVSGTIDVAEHQTQTLSCDKGTVKFPGLRVEKLGSPLVEADLLDAKGMTLAMVSANAVGALGTTTVTLDFFAPMGSSSSTAASSAASSVAASSSSGGTGGGGTGGATSSSTAASSGVASSSAAASTSAASSSAAASSSTSSGADAGH